jgi:hypothetical protein
MEIEQVKKFPPFERLLYWITEREAIRLKKEAGKPRPWTDDSILDKYRFTCPRRMDDRVSRWLMRNWYVTNHSMCLVHAALARFINLPDSLADVKRQASLFRFSDRWDPKIVKLVLHCRKRDGHNVFNGAYIVSTNGRAMDKIDHTIDMVVSQFAIRGWDNWIDTSSMQISCQNLQECYGVASFMAGQIVADLRWVLHGTWADACTWAAIGPGSRRGMNRLKRRPVGFPLKQAVFLEELRELIYTCNRRLPPTISSRLEGIDIQNCLCEFDKYERTLFDGKRPKATYKPCQ